MAPDMWWAVWLSPGAHNKRRRGGGVLSGRLSAVQEAALEVMGREAGEQS